MINKYKNENGDLKEYKVKKVSKGTAKNNKPFTRCNISDAKQVNGEWQYENYSIFSWQPNLALKDGDKITFDEITALEVKEQEWNGQKTLSRTIFAKINVVGGEQTDKSIEIVDDMQPLDDQSSELPF